MQLALEAGPNTLDLAVELGVSGVPLDGNALLCDLDAAIAPLNQRGLRPCQIGAFFFNPLHPDPSNREDSMERLSRLIPLAASINCPFIAFAAGSLAVDVFSSSHPGNLHEQTLSEAANALKPLVTLAERHGVKLTLEPHVRSVLCTPERAALLCSHVGSSALRVTFDVTNFYDFFDLLDPEPMRQRCATALATCCGMVHLKEISLGDGFHFHAGLAPLGQGATQWKAVIDTAMTIATAESWLLVEHCGSPAEARASIDLVRRAATELGRVLH